MTLIKVAIFRLLCYFQELSFVELLLLSGCAEADLGTALTNAGGLT